MMRLAPVVIVCMCFSSSFSSFIRKQLLTGRTVTEFLTGRENYFIL